MPTPFGPQLIGQTEKTLNALLAVALGDRLTEPQWVTLRLAHQLQGEVSGTDQLAHEVADRARFDDAHALVAGLTADGLLKGGRPTERGTALHAEIGEEIAALSAPVFADLPAAEVATATRVLNEVLNRARAVLA
jgi:hypothetical protein